AGPGKGLIIRYYPVINRTLLADDCNFDGEKENRAIFRAYAPRHYAGVFITGLVFLVIGIKWLIKQMKHKNGITTQETTSPRRQKNQKIKLLALLLIIIAFSIYKHWFEPGIFIIMIAIALAIAIPCLLFMHLRLPDWMYRYRLLLGKVVYLLFLIGLLLSFSLAFNKADIPAFLAGGAILLLFLSLLAIWSYSVQKKKWDQLKISTPYPEEKEDSISTSGGLICSVDEQSDESNEGRIVLMHNRLIFAAKDGTLTTIMFHSIRNIRIHRELLVIPVGLELTDYSNQKRYLVVGLPYYWKSKIRPS
ncbi:MAG: hypothetical protein PHY99_11105, partial [Bacteroidales bacterium]|nr:hypothetical protein [Bacteroidales bacterium]